MEQASPGNRSSSVKKSSKKLAIFLILALVILVGIGGFFYLHNKSSMDLAKLSSPKLFEKGDYKVEDRADGQYIVVDKVGLTAKVPTGWRVEFEGQDAPDGTSQYWVNLLSADAEKEYGLLSKGCGISILVGINPTNEQEIVDAINTESGLNAIKNKRPDFTFSIKSVSNKLVLESVSPNRQKFGVAITINLPIDNTLISFETRIPEGYESYCSGVWGTFLESIEVK
ncbi:MAG: hypothetical protein PHE77_00750 [Candidatus Pacebacteria bacterium]|nr:hypothetical protein [Candidatus Paceibacterota bacterium]